MINLIFKDFLTLSKNKSDLLEILFMPFLLITILGFALGGLLVNNPSIDSFSVGIVSEQDFEQDLNRFERELQDEGIPEPVVSELLANAEALNPAPVLEEVLQDDEIAELMVVKEFENEAAAKEALEADEIRGYLTIPAEFSYDYWQAIFFEEDVTANIDVTVQTEGNIAGNILKSVVSTFAEQYNVETSIAIATNGQAEVSEDVANHGEIIQISVEEPVSSFQYYTIGMGVMFALYTAPMVASRAFKEKEQHVFGRIMLSGMRPLKYLTSKLISGTLITFVQLALLFLLSSIIFGTFRGREFEFWMDMVYTTGLYSFLIGSLASLLTAISLNASDNTTVNFFGSFVSVFAFLGGSFTPVERFSEILKSVGNWTPNGAVMTSYLQIMQGFDFREVLPLMVRVIGMAVIAVIISVFVFPKRRLD